MNDRDLMENMLMLEKGACELFMHGTIESATPAVHAAFKSSLTELLSLQNQIYSEMASKGWYPAEKAEAQKIAAAKQKFCC